MKLSQFRCFLAVAEAGSVRQAARNLNLSQSSVTKSVQQLEESLQAELFLRGSHGLSPTAIGKMLISRVKSIEGELRQIRNDVETIHGGSSGEIRVSASPTVSVGILPRAVASFRKTRPNVGFHIEEGVYPDVLPAVRMGELDFAVALVPEMPTDEELQCELLLQDYLTPAVRVDHPMTCKGKLVLSDLLDLNWVIYRRSRTGRDIFERSFLSNGLTPPRRIIECTSFAATIALVENSDYVTLVPTQIFANRPRRTPITPLFMGTPMPPWDVTVISRRHHELSPLCMAFLEELRRTAEKARLSAS
ncbi:LysR family transcriptional regulator [Magnetospirillum sp. SS-4]|uniref:LysR family transcriptional regulator n=1 Tax=Magnetospirillum sp. SS-4 TaxID=2681465 RepID=UPI00137F1788|nr:LysR family transcriptional regulator [Magnetospirillum sp. SS-4]CAA7624984.1 putative RuBisCO transcriptional regulator [Magnetospirillum sp. SS-4]